MLSNEEYLIKIRPYLKYTINNSKNCDTWKINFISSKNNDEELVMHSKSDKSES